MIGLYNLCLSESLTINPGDLIILASTLCFALHIQLIAKYVHRFNGMHLSCLEFFLASVFCLFFSLIFEEPSLSQIENCLPSILFAGVLGIGVCYALQVTAQKYTDPTVAALLMSLESVFGALGGVLVLGRNLYRERVHRRFIHHRRNRHRADPCKEDRKRGEYARVKLLNACSLFALFCYFRS